MRFDVALICKALGDTNPYKLYKGWLMAKNALANCWNNLKLHSLPLSHHMKILCSVDWWICGKKVNGAITHSIAIRWRHLSILLIIFPALKRMGALRMIWDFIQNQILGMMWLNELIGFGLSAIGLDTSGRIGGSVQFFIYDTLKITILLCFLIFLISYIQSYFPPERSKKILGRFHGIWANIISALLGTVTPFCSCSSIPLFIGFTSAGLPWA